MRIFLTGAAGFIGSALARRLCAQGHEVVGLARQPARAPQIDGVRWVAGDLLDADGLEAARVELARATHIAHLAAVRKDWGLTAPQLDRVNVQSGPRLLELAERAERFLLVSSVAVYGHSMGEPTREETPFAPSKRYGVSKVAAERAMREAAAAAGRGLVIARPGIVYGPGDTYGMVANVARLLARRRFLLVGAGTSRVNLLYVDDLAAGLEQVLFAPAASDGDFIFAGPDAVPIAELVASMAAAVGVAPPPIVVPESLARAVAWGMERGYRAVGSAAEPFLTKAKVDLFTCEDLYDTARARSLLGFAPSVALADGAPRTVEWLRAAGELR